MYWSVIFTLSASPRFERQEAWSKPHKIVICLIALLESKAIRKSRNKSRKRDSLTTVNRCCTTLLIFQHEKPLLMLLQEPPSANLAFQTNWAGFLAKSYQVVRLAKKKAPQKRQISKLIYYLFILIFAVPTPTFCFSCLSRLVRSGSGLS